MVDQAVTHWEKKQISWWEKRTFTDTPLLNIAKDIVRVEASSLLEVGCGIAGLSEVFDVDSYSGIDLTPQAIEEAQKRYPQHSFLCGDAQVVNLPKVDACFMRDVVDHLPDFRPLFRNLFSVSDLVLVIFFRSPATESRIKWVRSGYWDNIYSRNEIQGFCSELGWSSIFYKGFRKPESCPSILGAFRRLEILS